MSQGKTALALMVALALPGAAQALGLGELHLNSALNEPLAGEIDIVGATAEDLAGITASVANQETFEHFGVDRPEFLSTVAFKISRDSRGRSVLAIRSRYACTEPLLNMLVDLRWRGGELVRQYTLLLDPPGFPSATSMAAANLGVPASYNAPVSVRPAASAALIAISKPAVEAPPASEKAGDGPAARKTLRVGAKATLRGIAWRVGSRSDADLKRMMIAIFRENPGAFEGNINRLRRGAVLTIPSAAEVSAISFADANREVHAQMQAWHPSTLVAGATKSGTPAVATSRSSYRESAMQSQPVTGSADAATIAPAGAAGAGSPAAGTIAAGSAAPADAALARRVQQLEKGLGQLRDELDREQDALLRAQALLTLDGKAPATLAPQQAGLGRGIGSNVAAMLALAAAAFGIYIWRRRKKTEPALAPAEPKMQHLAPVPVPAQAAVSEAPVPSTPGEPRAAGVESLIVPGETHGAPSAAGLPAETGERQGAADASASRRNGAATEPGEQAHSNDAIDTETLEASYLLEASGASLEDTADFTDTATVRISVDDRGAETMPVEVARGVGTPESTTQRLRTPENAMPAAKPGTEATKLDYNLLDLDATVQYVQMPSALHENVGFKERRTSLVDALKNAVEKEPRRWDLRMKLLETYYAAAATNRQGFLETVQNIAAERASLKEGEWDKIAWMGRQIASDDSLFAPAAAQPDEEDLANCA